MSTNTGASPRTDFKPGRKSKVFEHPSEQPPAGVLRRLNNNDGGAPQTRILELFCGRPANENLARRNRRDFLLRATSLFHRRLAVALLKVGQDDRQDELLFPVIIEFYNDILLVAREHAPEPELWMFDLGTLSEGRFDGHF
jgi:hypothetical protein